MAIGTGVEVSITELVQIIQQLNAELSDAQALAEAHNILNMADQGVMSTALSIRGTSEISVISRGTASEALTAYVNAGGKLSTTGAASANAISAANVTAFEAGGKISAGGILSLSLPTVAAAIAPVLGVGVGVGLYELNPDLWEKISRKLLPFCWENTEVVPAVVDENGQAYLPKEIFDAFQEIMQEEGIGSETITGPGNEKLDIRGPINCAAIGVGTHINANSIVESLSAQSPVFGTYYNLYDTDNNYQWTIASPSFFKIKIKDTYSTTVSSATVNGLPVYYHSFRRYGNNNVGLPGSAPQSKFTDSAKIGYVMLYGTVLQKYMPEGLSEWTGTTPPDYTQRAVNVVKNKDGASSPYYPVTLPAGDPGVSNNPSTRPNPTLPNPLPELQPYIPTIVQPWQYPEIIRPSEETITAPLPSPLLPELIIDTAVDPSLKYDPPKSPPITGVEDVLPPTVSIGDTPSPIFPIPGLSFPSIVPSSGSGLIHVYNPTPDEMIAFGHWLWVTYADASIQKLWNNPFDGVISAHELYATPSTDGRDNIRSGFLVCPTSAALVRQRYTQINCGSIVIPEWYNNYLDYAPYSKAHVYLPFIGIVELDVDDIVGHGINILYHVDAYNGSCIAQITVAKNDYTNTVYQFSGNCAVDLPLAGGSQAAIRAGLIGAAATGISSVVGGIASLLGGNIAGAVGGVSYGIGSAITQAVSQKSSVQHSGTFGASYGAMGIKKPYIIIRRPIQKQVLNYNAEYGFPAHKRVVIGQCEGFLRVREVHVQSPTATVEERKRIDELLREGIIINPIESSDEIKEEV